MLLKGAPFVCPAGDEFTVAWGALRAMYRSLLDRQLVASVRAGVMKEGELIATRFELERARAEEREMEALPWRGL